MSRKKDATLPLPDKRKVIEEDDEGSTTKKAKVLSGEEDAVQVLAPADETIIGPMEISVIQQGSEKAQQIVKQKEAVLDDSATKLQNLFQHCMNHLSQLAEGKSNEVAVLLQKLHELFVENQQLSDQLKRIQTQTAFLFQCIQSVQQEQEQAPLTEDSPEY